MAPGLLIIGDSQLKYAHEYAHLFPHFEISVISRSGMRVEEVDESMLLATTFFNDVVIHFGTNNLICGDTPDETVLNLQVLIEKIKNGNPGVRLYVSSVLRRGNNGRQGYSINQSQKMSVMNKKIEKLNELYKELAQRCLATFINHWTKFKVKSSNPERDFLSLDGLHLSPHGVKSLLGNVIHSCDLRHTSRTQLLCPSVTHQPVAVSNARLPPLPTKPVNVNARSSPLLNQAGIRNARSPSLPTQSVNVNARSSPLLNQAGIRNARFPPLPTQSVNVNARSSPLLNQAGISNARFPPLPTQSVNVNARSSPLLNQAGISNARFPPLPTQSVNVNARSSPLLNQAGISNARSPSLHRQPHWTLVSYHRKNFCGKFKSIKKTSQSSNSNPITLSNRWMVLVDDEVFECCNSFSAVISSPKKLHKCHKSDASQKTCLSSFITRSSAKEGIPSIISLPSSLYYNSTIHKYFHTHNIRINGGSSESGSSFSTYPRQCEVCKKTYSCKSSFCKHKKNCSKDNKSGSSIQYPRVCSQCNVSFSNRCNYSRHKRSCDITWKYIVCPCPGCGIKFQCHTDLISHMNEFHSEGVTVEEHNFKDMSAFQLWKSDVCRETNISMVKHSGVVSHASGSVQYFVCKFNNNHKKDVISNKTSRKRKFGTMPNTDCIARMIVKELPKDLSVHVKYFNNHNHDLAFKNVKYYCWDKFTKVKINSMLEQGVPAHNIQESFQPVDLDIKDEAPRKEHFISTTQINKMKYELKMKKRLNKDDALSVHMFVHSMKEEENSVLIYKPLNKCTEIGRRDLDNLPHASQLFALGIQNKHQLKEMVEGCTRILCIDSTHGTNHYKYHLLNFVVPDEYGVGYPVAHFITNFIDEQTLVCLLRSVKDKCSNLQLVVNAVMTDGDEALGNAIGIVFGEDTRHLLCSWHVKRNWQKNLNRKLRGQDALINEVNEILETMIEERNAQHFNAMLEAFLSRFSESGKPFISYFRENYVSSREKWAKCYRNFPHANTDTNMFVESFHSTLKTNYLNRKVNRRLDDLIKVLLQIHKSIHLSLRSKREMEVPPLGFGGSLKERHVRGLQIPDKDVMKNNDTSWRVNSQANSAVTYTVTCYSENCFLSDSCFIKCCELSCDNLCCHLYCCSCPDQHALCKHIHKVHSYKIRSAPSTKKSPILCHSGEQIIINSSSQIDQKAKEGDVIQSIANLCDKVKMLSRNSKVKSLLQHVNNSLKLVVEKCEGLISSEHAETRPSAMEHEHMPPNTKITPQYKLYRTVKERHNTKHQFKKPNLARQNEIKASLLSPLEEISFTSSITESLTLTKTLFKIGPCLISQLHLKSLDYFIPEEEVNRIKALAQDFHRGWLYDTVISAFLWKITNGNSLFTVVDPALSALAFRTEPLERFMTYIKKSDVVSSPHLLIPFNVTNSHWVLSLAIIENKEIHFYDPANGSLVNVYRRALLKWVQILSSCLGCDAEEWKIITPEHSFQDDGHNCGVYVCWYAERIVSGHCTTEKLNPYEYRKYIHDVIVGARTTCDS